MAAPKRNDIQIIEDRQYIAKLKRKGYDFTVITNKVNKRYKENGVNIELSKVSVWTDWKRMVEEWKDERLDDVELYQADMIDNFKATKLLAIEAYESGLVNHEKTSKKYLGDEKGKSSKKILLEEKIDAENLYGDPRFLKIMVDCDDKISKIQGLYVDPVKESTEKDNSDISTLSDEELNKSIIQISTNDK